MDSSTPLPQRSFTIAGHLLTLLALWFLVHIIYTTVLYPRFFTPLRHIPTPPKHSFLKGSHPYDRKTRMIPLRHWNKTIPNNGLIRFYLPGYQERLLVTSPKALSEILVANEAHFTKPDFVKIRLKYVTGNGLLLVDGEEHKMQRKSFMPAFSYRHIKNLYPAFWSKARELAQGIEKELKAHKLSNNDVIEMRGWASRATMDIIGLTGMDHDFDSLQDPNNSLSRQYRNMRPDPTRLEVFLALTLGLFSSNVVGILSKMPVSQMRSITAASNYVRNVCRSIIQEKQAKMKQGSSGTDVDIISVALQSDAFTSENLADQMMTFLAAGHGTTSDALQWAVYSLCKNTNLQKRLREEVRDKLPSVTGNDTISADELDSLPYLQAFCNEVLRYYPSVLSTAREAVQDTIVAGHRIPKGTVLTLAPGMTNHDPELWGPDADEFDPERWMREGCSNTGGVQNNYGFLTFLHGPRSCIGATFARAELACLVAAVVGRFEMALEDPDRELELNRRGISAAPADGVRVKLEVVEGW
ncbi:cytochrome P450 monooxygenase [Exophiala viscosa]|uniref:Cytochrome P450 monooxygenase n=1 Tax=Exophiala viscosa TaxID=2486360 RepID=A0AAN6E184_9EURO|nr:cytochrome P450 monooxygenase [Exophiala viscosa]KAI1630085.1 cytochrome P450 monooxygenase [Exophiala viscosa]